MRLYEFDNSNTSLPPDYDHVPSLWIPHKDDSYEVPRLSMDQAFELIGSAIAGIQSRNAIDQARGFTDWSYSDDLAIDLENITSSKEVIQFLENELYRQMELDNSRKEIAAIFQKIVDDPAWLRFIINIESILTKYVVVMANELKHGWAPVEIFEPRTPPKLPANRAEYSDKAASFIDKLKNVSENMEYDPKTLPSLSTILRAAKVMRKLITNYMSIVINPCMKKLAIESPYIKSVFDEYSLHESLEDYYTGAFMDQVLDGLDELEEFARETLK